MKYDRNERLKSIFLRELSSILKKSIKDPQFEDLFINISDIVLTKDLSCAYVYLSFFDQEKGIQVVDILRKKAPFIQGIVGRDLHLKRIPKFVFRYDDHLERTQALSQIFHEIENNEGSHES